MAINRHILQLLHLTYEAFYMKIHSIAFVIIRKRHFLSYVSQDVFAQYWPHVWLTVIVWYKNAHRDSELYVICTIWNRMFCHIAVSTGLSMWHCYYYYYFVIAVSTGNGKATLLWDLCRSDIFISTNINKATEVFYLWGVTLQRKTIDGYEYTESELEILN